MPLSKRISDIVNRFSPVFLEDRHCNSNIPTAVNFDNDWDPTNNETSYELAIKTYRDLLDKPEHYRGKGFANVYYEAIASKTHVYLTFYLFYPHDAGDNCAFGIKQPGGGHQNDASSMMLIVRKGASAKSDKLEYVITSDHEQISVLRPEEIKTADGKPIISISSGNHTMEAVKPESQLPAREDNYYFGDKLGEKYSLIRIFDSLWMQRNNNKLFCANLGFTEITGARFCRADDGIKGRGTPPWAPWARTFVEGGRLSCGFAGKCLSFSDPINAFKHLYQNDSAYSTEYDFNPYSN
jgi:hypothetical protein